jgi:hypothetical protein
MPKLIEIIGPPGSGKSFISGKLEKIRFKNKKIFFHSNSKYAFKTFNNLNFVSKLFIRFKVIFLMIIFYSIFNERIFLKKIYRRSFFIRVFLVNYRDLIYIETFKKILSNNDYLLIEPGMIMHFLQDFFYINKSLPLANIRLFNKFFLKSNLVIYFKSNTNLSLKRLNSRKRGLPQRMRNLHKNKIINIIKNSLIVLNTYVSNFDNNKTKIVEINSKIKVKNIKKKIMKLLINI